MAQPNEQNLDFARRINRQTGRTDSICRYCYQTIASSHTESTLRLFEMQHDCPSKPKALAQSA
jgi:hypothetical protein